MNIKNFLKQSSIYNVLAVESFFTDNFRKRISKISKIIVFILIICLLTHYFFNKSEGFATYKKIIENFSLVHRTAGLILFNTGIILLSQLVSFYLSSTYYFEKIIGNKYSKDEIYTFSAGRVLYAGRNTDMLHGFLKSEIGQRALLRLGINKKEIKKFYLSQKIEKNQNVPSTGGEILKLKDIVKYIYDTKTEFRNFLNNKGITDTDFFGVIDFIVYKIELTEYESEWWRPESLARIKSIADEWAFGKTYFLESYGRNVLSDPQVLSEAFSIVGHEEEVQFIENTLSKSSGANAMIIGNPGQEKMQIIWSFARKIKNKTVASQLLNKTPIMLSVSALSSVCKMKDDFEEHILKIFAELLSTKNIILIIDNFGQLIKLANSLGSDFANIIDPFMVSPSIQVLALTNTDDYKEFIEQNKTIMNRFETLITRPLSTEETIKIISSSSLISEAKYKKTIFTYQAVREISENILQFFPNGVTQNKAITLLNEIALWSKKNKVLIIKKEDIINFIKQKK